LTDLNVLWTQVLTDVLEFDIPNHTWFSNGSKRFYVDLDGYSGLALWRVTCLNWTCTVQEIGRGLPQIVTTPEELARAIHPRMHRLDDWDEPESPWINLFKKYGLTVTQRRFGFD
jgi:hypothetical protein